MRIIHETPEKFKQQASPIDWAERASRRAGLRFVVQRIQFVGRDAYRAGRRGMGIKDDVSIFDMDANDLGRLARAMAIRETIL